jgi:hypothetical protein
VVTADMAAVAITVAKVATAADTAVTAAEDGSRPFAHRPKQTACCRCRKSPQEPLMTRLRVVP